MFFMINQLIIFSVMIFHINEQTFNAQKIRLANYCSYYFYLYLILYVYIGRSNVAENLNFFTIFLTKQGPKQTLNNA